MLAYIAGPRCPTVSGDTHAMQTELTWGVSLGKGRGRREGRGERESKGEREAEEKERSRLHFTF